MLDDAEVEFVDHEEGLDTPDYESMLQLALEDEGASIVVAWNAGTDVDRLASALVDLMKGRCVEPVLASIGRFGAHVGDPRTADLLARLVRERMAARPASDPGRPLVPPRAAIQLLMRRGASE